MKDAETTELSSVVPSARSRDSGHNLGSTEKVTSLWLTYSLTAVIRQYSLCLLKKSQTKHLRFCWKLFCDLLNMPDVLWEWQRTKSQGLAWLSEQITNSISTWPKWKWMLVKQISQTLPRCTLHQHWRRTYLVELTWKTKGLDKLHPFNRESILTRHTDSWAVPWAAQFCVISRIGQWQ